MFEGRFNYLRAKYDALYTKQGQLKLGERYMLHSFENPDHIKSILQDYVDDGLELLQVDQEILELISHHDKPYYTALKQVFNPIYHEIPDIFKYSIDDILKVNTFYHGPPLDICGAETSLTFQPGVAFKNHKYFHYFKDYTFDYNTYDERLKELVYNDDGNPPLGISNVEGKGSPYLSDSPTRYVENPDFDVIKIDALWEYFKDSDSVITNETLKECTHVIELIESGVSCAFSYGQFSQVFQCLKHMKMQAGKNTFFSPLYPSKLKEYIYYGKVTCGSNYSEERRRNYKSKQSTIESKPKQRIRKQINIKCDVNYTIVVDLMHRLVVIKQHGKHSEDCELRQKQRGYLFYRKQIVKYGEEQAKILFDPKLIQRYGSDDIIKLNKKKWFVKKRTIFTRHDRSENTTNV